jgi:CHAT domain-containing protein/Flp pilus assembly protein TadD
MKPLKYASLLVLLFLKQLAFCQAGDLDEAKKLIEESKRLIQLQQYERALPLCQRELLIMEKTFGPNHKVLLLPLNDLGVVYLRMSNFALAGQTLERALLIAEANPDAGYLDTILNNLASVYQTEGDYRAADPLQARALKLRLESFGRNSLQYGIALDNLALLKRREGDYVAAESFSSQAVDVLESVKGDHDGDLAGALDNLASIHDYKSDYSYSEPLHKRAITILERLYGERDPSLVIPLNDLAAMYDDQQDFVHAEPLYKRSVEIGEANAAVNDPELANSLSNLGLLYIEMSRFKDAEPLLKKALNIRVSIFGEQNPDVARVNNNLGTLYQMEKDFPKAEESYNRALKIWRKLLGNNHPDVAAALSNLALLKWISGDPRAASAFLKESNAIYDANLRLVLFSGSEAAKRAYLEKMRDLTDSSISFYSDYLPRDPGAAGDAAALVLSRKGRIIDAMADELGILRQHLGAEERKLFDQLTSVRSQLADVLVQASYSGDGARVASQYQQALDEEDRIEREISARSSLFKSQDQPVTLNRVQDALSSDSLLIEYVSYLSFNYLVTDQKTAAAEPRYAVYVLSKTGLPAWINLGPAAPIDAMVEKCRKSLSTASSPDAKKIAADAFNLLLGPLATYLKDKQRLFIAPDGALNLVSFAALINQNGRYLGDEFTLTYLPSGRDLVRRNDQARPRTPPLLVANPDYDLRAPDNSSKPNHPVTTTSEFHFAPLSTREAAAIQELLPTATLSTGASATKDMLERVRAPAALHIATHGFFLDPAPDKQKPRQPSTLLRESNGPADLHDPLVRSGLALAGANHSGDGGNRGLLTALEASTLDLWGTQLVVLSACDTGVGKVSNGDGVYGLRRAMALAGARCQIMSLWKVDDYATRDLMTSFYQEVLRGVPVADALRTAQKTVANQPERDHPYYWASFIATGECDQVDLKTVITPSSEGQVAAKLSEQGMAYADQGRLTEAEPLFERALAIDEDELRPNHPDLTKDVHRLAGVYAREDKIAQAQPLLERALASEEQAPESQSSDLMIDLAYLGLIYAAEQRLNESEILLQRAATLAEKTFKSGELDLATFYHNLAGVYYQEHKYAEAEPLLHKALAIRAQNDPDRVSDLNYLASVYFHLQKFADAEPLLRQAAALQEKVSGPDDQDLATILGNLAFDLEKQGRKAEASPYNERAATIRAKEKELPSGSLPKPN